MRRLVMICVAMTCIATARAQTGPKILPLDLDKAIELALSDNPTIKVANLEIERYDYVRKETVGNLLPNLSASGQYSYSVVKQEMAKGLSFGADNTITATASLSLPLFAPAVYATMKLNKIEMQNAVESARSSRINLISEVKKAFYNILLAERSLKVLRSSEKTIAETVENTRNMYDNGLASEYDLLTAEVQLSNLQPTIIQTENSIEVAKMLLKMYLSIPEDVSIAVRGDLDDFSSTIAAGRSAAFSTDISENSELRTLEIQESLLRQQLRLNNTQRMPTIAAFGSATYTGNDMVRPNFSAMMGGGSTGDEGGSGDSGTASTSRAAGSFWWQHPISAGVQINIPIFSGFRNTNKNKQIKNAIEQLRLQRDYLSESTSVQVRSSINSIITARETMYANEKTVAQAQKAYDIANTRYQHGAGTILELNSAELSLTQAKLNYSQAIYDYLSAYADYDRILGRER